MSPLDAGLLAIIGLILVKEAGVPMPVLAWLALGAAEARR